MKKFWPMLFIWILCQVIAFLAFFRMGWACFTNRKQAWLMAAPYDFLLNYMTNDTEFQWFSVRAAKACKDKKKWGCFTCWLLDKADPGHCQRVYDNPGIWE